MLRRPRNSSRWPRGCRFAALVGGLAALASAVPAAEPTPEADATPDAPTFAIRLSQAREQRMALDPETGRTLLSGVTLRALAAQAWVVHPRDVKAHPASSDPPGLDVRYDVVLEPGPEAPRRRGRELLRKGLQRALGLSFEREATRVPVNRLQRIPEAAPLEPSTADAPSVERSEGRLAARAMPIAELVVFLRWHSPRPILDETGLDERYDFVVEWDPNGGTRELFLALGDLGLQITRGRDDYPFLYVKRSPTEADD